MNYSIIIPYCDTPDVLTHAVQSVPCRQDIEVLVVDNGREPLDKSFFIERQNIKILYSPHGKGAGRARNVGLAQATGKWLLLLDADDCFTNDAFEHLDKQLSATEDIVFFKFTSNILLNKNSKESRHIELNTAIEQYWHTHDENVLRYNWPSPCGKMIRMQLITEHKIRFEETHAANDVMFSLLTGYYAKNVKAVDATIYCVTTRDGSLTTTSSLQNLTDRIEVSARYNKFVRSRHLARYQKSIMYYIYTACKRHGLMAAIRLLCHSIAIGNNPFVGITHWITTYKKQ
jgi:glycosyltransferase involved in cell wall biosynthesis